jgi:hypothetical protein
MKRIEPIQAWKNGEQLEANFLNAFIIRDNMKDFAEFYYSLKTGGEGTEAMPLIMGQAVAEGNLTMDGENYLAWNGSNDYAFSYIAEKLNLTLINE